MRFGFLQRPFWPVAFLYAGFYFNAALLGVTADSLIYKVDLRVLPLILLGCGAFLYYGVMRAPLLLANAGLGNLGEIVKACLGTVPAAIVQGIVSPAWLAAWFLINSYTGLWCLRVALFSHRPIGQRPSQFDGWLPTVLWTALIVPAAAGGTQGLPRVSLFASKVSVVAVLSLTIAADFEHRQYFDMHRMAALSAGAPILLWALPALLMAGVFTVELPLDRWDLKWLGWLGIIIPIVLAVSAAVITVSGHAALAGGHTWNYMRFVAIRPKQFGWAKSFIMLFSVLTAARFSAASLLDSVGNQLKPLWRWIGCIVLCLPPNLIFTQPLSEWRYWSFQAWLYLAVPFVPLAGVIAACCWLRGGKLGMLNKKDRILLCFAWVSGFALCFCRSEIVLSSDSYYNLPTSPWLLPAWLLSFALSSLILTLRRRSTQPAQTPA